MLAYSPAPATSVVRTYQSALPPRWFIDPTEGHIIRPRGPGKIARTVAIGVPGMYDVWVMGSFGRGVDLFVDGRRIGSAAHQLSGRGQYKHVAAVELDRGRHTLRLVRGGGSLEPGDGLLEMIGPVTFTERIPEPYSVRYVRPDEAARLCNRSLDWLEVVRQ